MPEQEDPDLNSDPEDASDGLPIDAVAPKWDSDELESEDDEFSLDQLSAAYAQVLNEQNKPSVMEPTDESVGSEQIDDESELAEKDSDPRTLAENSQHESELRSAADEAEQEPNDDDACPISPRSILESILFVGGPKEVKLTSRTIAALMRDVSPKEITTLVKQMNQSYEKERRAYRIVGDKQALRMELHPEMIPVQNHILGRNRATRLTQQAIDVLAIVAYNQPIPREGVDKIRGKPSSSIINQMVRRNLLQMEVTESTPKQKLFRTTDRFLDLFGLDSVDDLPQSHIVSDIEELAD